MVGTLVNASVVVGGSILGLLLKNAMPERFKHIYFQAVGLFTLVLGISMTFKIENILIIVGSLILGGMTGELLRLEDRVEELGHRLLARMGDKYKGSLFTEGLITAFLLFCVGSMTILGTIQEGLEGKTDLIYTKSVMDFFSSIILSSAFGAGVIFSAIPLLIFQGGLTLLASYSADFFSPTIIAGISSTGGILLIGLSFNLLEIKKLKIMNLLPSLLYTVILLWLFA